jgi:hypothetical protein
MGKKYKPTVKLTKKNILENDEKSKQIEYIKFNFNKQSEHMNLLLKHINNNNIGVWRSDPIEHGFFSCLSCQPFSQYYEPNDYNTKTIIEHLKTVHN